MDFNNRKKIILATLLLALSAKVHAQLIDDWRVGYSRMQITEVEVGGRKLAPTFYRHNALIEAGIRDFTFGLTFQHTGKSSNTLLGKSENGLMFSASYDHIISQNYRLQTFARIGYSKDTDDAQPIYSTDTDLRLTLVGYLPEGMGSLRQQAFFPSYYAGLIINKYGRLQAISGGGMWWNKFGLYLTGFHSFNGVEDPMHPGKDGDKIYANLENRGVTLDISYTIGELRFSVKRNFVLKNGGNDLTFGFDYVFYPGGDQ